MLPSKLHPHNPPNSWLSTNIDPMNKKDSKVYNCFIITRAWNCDLTMDHTTCPCFFFPAAARRGLFLTPDSMVNQPSTGGILFKIDNSGSNVHQRKPHWPCLQRIIEIDHSRFNHAMPNTKMAKITMNAI